MLPARLVWVFGADDKDRTHDIHLVKVTLYR